jgi:hypothetical protein
MNTDELLAERAKTHGEYTDHARCTQTIMRALMGEKNWSALSDIQKESLHMFAHKMGRIVTGNPDIHDHWDDIAGYAKLVSDRIPKEAPAEVPRRHAVAEDTETAAMASFARGRVQQVVAENRKRWPRMATHAEYQMFSTTYLSGEHGHRVSDLYDSEQKADGRYHMHDQYVGIYGA